MKVRMFDLRVSDNQINKELNYHFKKVLKHGKFFFGPELYEIENKISELSKKGKNIFLLFHSNSSPKIANFNYHKSFSSQIENKSNNNVFEEEFESIIKKIIKIKNITFVIDDFDKLDLNKSMYLIDNKEFKITCNYLIIKT